ncbi:MULTISPECIES: 3-deoxy-D-manno-octulosonic acid transferase [unclassified Yoonia]|uniref:3-deoxy-D-manno-octulosonic acid transferase n=1 Tax=unclassified Yoonia TaxID=2629118 RepID=UPI002AFE2302|nr:MULTISPECIES: glycosyltransferase N-terminal domain-containing protein [unclassified Yoonia]
MARSLKIAAYVAGLRRAGPDGKLAAQPDRPQGAIIWARCSLPEQLTAVETLQRKLAEDADAIQIIATVPVWDDSLTGRAFPEPRGKDNIRAFIAHWQPMMAIWVQGDLDLVLLDGMRAAALPCILVDANGKGLDQVPGGWVPGAIRSLLSQFQSILAIDQPAVRRLVGAGAPQSRVVVTGPMEDCGQVLSCDEEDRRVLSAAIGTRPVWLAAAATLNDTMALSLAHQVASRRAHRLLLVVVPDRPENAGPIADDIRRFGFHVALRSQSPEPDEPIQVFVIDTDDDLGLWYRIAPVTYLGGTLHGGGCRDPFEPASLGSAVLYGPYVAPFQRHAARLTEAKASRLIRTDDQLGATVEALLAPDKTAEMAHAAWDVTSRGADVTNRIVTLIRQRLEERVG